VPLEFLRGRWLVEAIVDGPAGLVSERHVVTCGTLRIPVVAEGGFAVVACRWTPAIQTYDLA
jgi:alpha-glucosidase